jgi:hypothetical protein
MNLRWIKNKQIQGIMCKKIAFKQNISSPRHLGYDPLYRISGLDENSILF